jgi:hypothetical protein
MPVSAEEAAAARSHDLLDNTDGLSEMLGVEAEEAEEAPLSSESEAEAEAEDEEIPELPEDLARELEVDFEEDDVETSPASEAQETVEDEPWLDDETKELRAKLAAVEKKNQFLEKQRLEVDSAKWHGEAFKYFPYADYTTINATSKRSYLRQAKASHEKVMPHILAEREKYNAKLEEEKARIAEEYKAEAANAWGVPAVQANSGTGAPAPRKRLTRSNANAAFVERTRERLNEL